MVLDDPVHATVDPVPTQHFENDILGAGPRRELPSEPDAPDLRHFQVERFPRYSQGHLGASDADGQHPERTRCRGVAVGADHGLARNAEPLHVGWVRYPVAGLREPQTEPETGGAEKIVVFRVLAVVLQEVVVDVLDGHFGACAVEPQGLQLKHDQGSGRVLGQGLVNMQTDL